MFSNSQIILGGSVSTPVKPPLFFARSRRPSPPLFCNEQLETRWKKIIQPSTGRDAPSQQ